MRKRASWIVAAVAAPLFVAAVVVAQGPDSSLVITDAQGDSVTLELPSNVDVIVDDTTTTQTPTTTTETPPTTTTVAPPTTTQVPPTTTTTDPGVVLGPDPASPNNNQVCAPANGVNDFCHWDVYFGAALDAGTPRTRLWETPYSWRSAEGDPLWFPGTRDGYSAQWQFLECDGTPGFEARIAFRMGYGNIESFQIGDRGGNEGVRMWDGSLASPQGRETGDKPRDPVQPGPNLTGPSQPPTFRLYNLDTGVVCEVRDYELAEDVHSHGSDPQSPVAPNVKFAVDVDDSTDASFLDDRAFITAPFMVHGEKVVHAYLDNVEAVTGYYTSMDANWEWDWEQEP